MSPLVLSSKIIFLFDLDDTLIDSAALHEAAFRDVLARRAPDILRHFYYENFKGQPTAVVFRKLGFNDENTVKALTAEKQSEYRRRAANELKPIPNAVELLSHLDATGRRLFLVTGGSAESVKGSLSSAGLNRFFQGVIASEDVCEPKPDPEPYKACLEKYGLRAEDSLVVEDSLHGVRAAQSAGIDVVGVNNPLLAYLDDNFFPTLFALGKALGQPIPKEACL